ncbi:hypothetical protein BMS3Bbin01_02441 [bacterium BMS3Bbin01]|nr:hypothetical protein BMS3Bbin01_02441 [bacterium BMS3Bbin01]
MNHPSPDGSPHGNAKSQVVSLKGDSYRLKDRDLRRIPTDNTQ